MNKHTRDQKAREAGPDVVKTFGAVFVILIKPHKQSLVNWL